jgi:hypothetical protein
VNLQDGLAGHRRLAGNTATAIRKVQKTICNQQNT